MIEKDRNILLFGGIVSLVFGILLFTQTTATLAIVMLLVGVSWFIQGLVTVFSVFVDKQAWGWKVFSGIIGLAAGLLVLQNPVASTVAIPAVIAIVFGILGVLIGASALISAFQGEGWGVGIFGAVSLLIGFSFVFNSVLGGQVLIWLNAALLVAQGVIGMFFAFSKR